MSSNSDFFPFEDIDPKKKPDKPEPIDNDWDYDDYDDKCSFCGQIYDYHTRNQALFCAEQILNNLGGQKN